MNLLRSEAKKLVQDLSSFNDSSVEMILFPPALFLQEVREYKNESIYGLNSILRLLQRLS